MGLSHSRHDTSVAAAELEDLQSEFPPGRASATKNLGFASTLRLWLPLFLQV